MPFSPVPNRIDGTMTYQQVAVGRAIRHAGTFERFVGVPVNSGVYLRSDLKLTIDTALRDVYRGSALTRPKAQELLPVLEQMGTTDKVVENLTSQTGDKNTFVAKLATASLAALQTAIEAVRPSLVPEP